VVSVPKALNPLRRPELLHVSVQESLKAYIAENRLAPGSPLPPEGELAQQLGVSRGSVREAIRGLASLGIVESRRGIGVFVADFSFGPLLDNLAFGLRHSAREIAEVLQIRRVLEVGLIGDAAAAASEADIAELRRITDGMRAHADRGESFATEDQAFHQAMFRSLGNAMLLRLLDVFWLAFFKAANDLTLANPDPVATWRDHHAIVEALAVRDVAAARRRLDQHYDGIAGLLARRQAEATRNEPEERTP
jgi:DNA-binding FadR family transcriptional regulator